MKIDPPTLLKIQQLCKSGKVKFLFAFGALTREDFHAQSDIDLVVDFEEKDPFKYTDLYFAFKQQLESVLDKPIYILEARAIRNPYFKEELDKTQVIIYEQ